MSLRGIFYLCMLGALLLLFTGLALYALCKDRPVLTAAAGNLCFAFSGILFCFGLGLGVFAGI